MYTIFFTLLICFIIILFVQKTENFVINYDDPNYLVDAKSLKPQKNLIFLDDVNNSLLKVLKNKLKKDGKNPQNRDCISIPDHVSEYENPYFYLSETINFPAPWTVKTFKDLEYPKQIDIKSFYKKSECCNIK